ncbi:MAG TPA: UPF0280 family protein [Desulfobulbaceae bacterium]|nr:UPF0280 family protein [Desulfobulbaceae bacterium]
MGQERKRKKNPHSYQERSYRLLSQSGLIASKVQLMETDLHIMAKSRVEDHALALVAEVRTKIELYINNHPEFLHSLVPLADDPAAPAIIRTMLAAGHRTGVGPMAAVAGAVAEYTGRGLELLGHDEIIVENGGDIYVRRNRACTISIYAGESPLSGKVGIRLQPEHMPCGVCTSSAAIGHSLSLGASDAAVVVASETAFADALATRLGNEVRAGASGLNRALAVVKDMEDVTGAVLIAGKKLGAWGALQLVKIDARKAPEQA